MSQDAKPKNVSCEQSTELHDYKVCVGLCIPIVVSMGCWLIVLFLVPMAGTKIAVLDWMLLIAILGGLATSILGIVYSLLSMILERSFGRKRCFLYCLIFCVIYITFSIVGCLAMAGQFANAIS